MIKAMSVNEFGIRADNSYFEGVPKLQMPDQKGNKVVTLNNQGFMRVELDEFSRRWVKEASTSSLPFLELGAAYGQATITALNEGGMVIANDISIDHLNILRNRTDVRFYKNLFLNHKSFPDEIDFSDNSIGGVLFCRLGHFFTDERIQIGLKKIYDWLAPNGRLFFTAVSPYHYTLKDDFLPIFLRRKANKENNVGYIADMRKYISQSFEHVPMFMNSFDEDNILKLFSATNFKIETCKLFDFSSNNSDHKGFIGVQAIK